MFNLFTQTFFGFKLKTYFFYVRNYWNRKLLVKELRRNFKGKKVLILGSGPTLEEIVSIPDDFIVVCCNFSINYLEEHFFGRRANLYLTTNQAVSEGGGIEKILKAEEYDVLVHNFDNKLISKFKLDKKNSFFNLPQDVSLLSLVAPNTYRKRYVFGKEQNVMLSSGCQLVQYGIIGEAEEIFLAGIDTERSVSYFQDRRYVEDESSKKNNHYLMDSSFLEECTKYNNIFVASPKSPVSALLPTKNLFK